MGHSDKRSIFNATNLYFQIFSVRLCLIISVFFIEFPSHIQAHALIFMEQTYFSGIEKMKTKNICSWTLIGLTGYVWIERYGTFLTWKYLIEIFRFSKVAILRALCIVHSVNMIHLKKHDFYLISCFVSNSTKKVWVVFNLHSNVWMLTNCRISFFFRTVIHYCIISHKSWVQSIQIEVIRISNDEHITNVCYLF